MVSLYFLKSIIVLKTFQQIIIIQIQLVAVAESIYAFLRQQKLTNAYFFKHYQFHTYVRII